MCRFSFNINWFFIFVVHFWKKTNKSLILGKSRHNIKFFNDGRFNSTTRQINNLNRRRFCMFNFKWIYVLIELLHSRVLSIHSKLKSMGNFCSKRNFYFARRICIIENFAYKAKFVSLRRSPYTFSFLSKHSKFNIADKKTIRKFDRLHNKKSILSITTEMALKLFEYLHSAKWHFIKLQIKFHISKRLNER